jgi:carboxylesterase
MSKKPFGALLIHGFGGSPEGLRGISNELETLGIPCWLPVLRGHCAETPEALLGIDWTGWVADGERALFDLLIDVEQVIVIGHSMGGWIALNLAIDHREKIDSIVIAAASTRSVSPLGPHQPLHLLVPLIVRMQKRRNTPPVYADPSLAKYFTGYDWKPTIVYLQVFDFMKVTEKRLPEVNIPILIMHSKNDSANSPKGAEMLFNRISTSNNQKQLVWFEKTEHDMFVDCEREEVIKTLVDHVKECIDKGK